MQPLSPVKLALDAPPPSRAPPAHRVQYQRHVQPLVHAPYGAEVPVPGLQKGLARVRHHDVLLPAAGAVQQLPAEVGEAKGAGPVEGDACAVALCQAGGLRVAVALLECFRVQRRCAW